MLHREPSQLFLEWEERFEIQNANELIPSIRQGNTPRDLLEFSLREHSHKFRSWFYEDTGNLLKRLPESVPQETAFLMAFLLLCRKGLHIDPDG